MSDTAKRTLVEEGTTFKGSLTSSCPVLVKGAIEGDLTTPSLTVASSGSVSGKVKTLVGNNPTAWDSELWDLCDWKRG